MTRKGDVWTLKIDAKHKVRIVRLDISERIGTAYRFKAEVYTGAKQTVPPHEMKWDTKDNACEWIERKLKALGV